MGGNKAGGQRRGESQSLFKEERRVPWQRYQDILRRAAADLFGSSIST